MLDAIPYSPVLADLGYLGKELKKRLEAKGIDFLTPIRKNMKGAVSTTILLSWQSEGPSKLGSLS
ncbi:transposase [Streptococcus parasanguinis]|uniref:transposase n=1 Tax=Streptococcus parasanguinis TaxID=1318 RepID=UPI00352F4FD1